MLLGFVCVEYSEKFYEQFSWIVSSRFRAKTVSLKTLFWSLARQVRAPIVVNSALDVK